MLTVVPDRWRWVRENPLDDVAIVVLTPPFLPQSLQALRVFRLLRLVRLLALVRYARKVFTLDWCALRSPRRSRDCAQGRRLVGDRDDDHRRVRRPVSGDDRRAAGRHLHHAHRDRRPFPRQRGGLGALRRRRRRGRRPGRERSRARDGCFGRGWPSGRPPSSGSGRGPPALRMPLVWRGGFAGNSQLRL
jgi:hypothetical protein